MSPRIVARPIAAVFSIASILGAGLMLHACAQPSQISIVAPAAAPSPVSAVATAIGGARLDLCRPPDLPPPDLRAKPGYTQLRVTVVSAQQTPIHGLKQSDFTIRVGQQTYPIAYFREENASQTPVSVITVSDVSATMYNKTFVGNDRLKFLSVRNNIDGAVSHLNACDEMAMVTVGGVSLDPRQPPLSAVTYVQSFTTDQDKAMGPSYAIKPSGEKLLSDGIMMGLTAVANSDYANRALVVVTDGLDPEAMEKSEKFLEATPRGAFSFWVIGIGDPDASASSLAGARRLDTEAVKRLAQAGGGHALFARSVNDDNGSSLADAINTINGNLTTGYTIGVILPPSSEAPVVTVANQPDVSTQEMVVPTQFLTAAAGRPERTVLQQCTGIAQVPASISSMAGFRMLNVAVTSAEQKPVTALKQADFAASCGGTSCPIVYFQGESCEAVAVAIAIDTSQSMTAKLPVVTSVVKNLIDHLGPNDSVALLAFSSQPYLLQASTKDHDRVKDKLSVLRAYGQTALYDSMAASAAILRRSAHSRKAIVLVTDGIDNISHTSMESLLTDLRTWGVVVYAIGIGTPSETKPQSISVGPFTFGGDSDQVDVSPLREMANATGGESFGVGPIDTGKGALASAASTISKQLNSGSEYVIGVTTSASSSDTTLTVPGHPEYTVSATASPPKKGS